MKRVVALLLTEDPFAVFAFVFASGWILLVLSIQLCQTDGERDEHQQEQAKKLAKLLKHLTHGDLQPHTYTSSATDIWRNFRLHTSEVKKIICRVIHLQQKISIDCFTKIWLFVY